MSLRLFVAVAVPEAVRADLERSLAGLRRAHPWLRWTDPSHWHLTLAFPGWVEEARAADVHAAVGAAAVGRAPFRLRLDGRLGSFGRRVLWAGIGASAELEALAEAARTELAARGVAIEDRPFHAHLTVARAPRDRRMPPGLGAETALPERAWEVSELLVMRSHLRRGGARYEVAARSALG